MELHLSRKSISNVVLSSTPVRSAGGSTSTLVEALPVYHIYTPGHLTRGTTYISRISSTAALDAEHNFKSPNKGDIKEASSYKGGVEEYARIHWHSLRSTRLVYNKQMIEFDQFLTGSGLIGSNKTFTGPDGMFYSWQVGQTTCQLTVASNDGQVPQIVAKFHQQDISSRFSGKPWLEIRPVGLHIVDLIVITWVFVESKRRDLEKRQPF